MNKIVQYILKINDIKHFFAEKIQIVFLLIFVFLFSGVAKSQIISPVQANLSIMPMYSPYLNDYYEAGSNKLSAILILKDLSEPSWDVKLKLTIAGDNGILLETKPTFNALNQITLTPGVPLQISGSEWVEYLDYNALNISGIDRNTFIKNGQLPEGFYSFSLEVLDKKSGKLLSNKATVNVLIRLGGIPQIIKPTEKFIAPQSAQNIMFQWSLTAPALNPAKTEYQLKLYEITNNDIDPSTAVKNGAVLEIFASQYSISSFFLYDANSPLLELGKKYAYTIQVRDADQQNMFKNNGMSDAYWFNYGFPTGGLVELLKPVVDYQFVKDEVQHFKWKTPNNKANPNQLVRYYFKVVVLTSKDQNLKEAIAKNPTFFEKTSNETSSINGWEEVVDKEFERDAWYAWQVVAYSGDQKVAESPVQRFKGIPLLDGFQAGDHYVKVTRTDNSDLNNFKGIGRIKLDKDGKDTLDIAFDGIKLKKAGNLYTLIGGALFSETTIVKKKDIKAKIEGQEDASFTPNAVKLDKDRLAIRGKLEMPIDLAIDGKKPRIISDDVWINYNNFNIRGGIKFSAKFDLMDPANFSVLLDTNSTMIVGNTGYEVFYYGGVGLPESTKDVNGNRILIPIKNLQKIDYLEVDAASNGGKLPAYRPIPNSEFVVYPTKYIIDFSETKSPEGFDKDWKGAYVSEYKYSFTGKLDKKGAISITDPWEGNIKQEKGGKDKNYFTPGGLQFEVEMENKTEVKGTFNKFPAKPKVFKVKIENGSVKEGQYTGSVVIPIINPDKNYNFTSQMSDDGFQEGYLDEKLDNLVIYFSKESETSRMEYTVKRAIFADAEKLNMTVDINIPVLKVSAPNVADFNVYGDYQIGFKKRSGAVVFDKQLSGNYKGVMELLIDTIGASFLNGKYCSYSSSQFKITDDIGTPRLHTFSTIDVAKGVDVKNDYSSPPPISTPVTVLNASPKDVKLVDSVFVELKCPVAECQGYIKVVENDPDWGNVMRGNIKGFIRVTSQINCGAEIIVGKKDKLDYWFFNAYAQDKGIGIPLIPGIVNIVALEGKIFKNMSAQVASDGKSAVVKIDSKVKYGGALYMQLIDAETNGKTLKSDIGLEMKFYENDFELAMRGEATILNASGRSATTGGAADAIKDKVEKSTGADKLNTATMAIEQINKASIPVADWTFHPNIKLDVEGKSGTARLYGKNGNTEIGIGGSISQGGYYGTVDYANEDWKVGVSTNLASAIGFSIEKKQNDPFSFSFLVNPGDTAGVSFKKSGYGVTGGVNMSKKSAGFGMDFGDKHFKIFGNMTAKSGSIEFTPTSSILIAASANMTKKEGSFKVKTEDHTFSMVASKSGTSALTFDDKFNISFDNAKKEGALAINVSGFDLNLKANSKAGSILCKTGGVLVSADADMNQKKGAMVLEIDKDNKFSFDINTAKQTGNLNLQVQGNKFAIGTGEKKGDGMFELTLANSNSIAAKANLISKTGSFKMKFDNNAISSTLTQDSVGLYVKTKDVAFTVGASTKQRGVLGYKIGQDSLRLFADKSGKGEVYYSRDNMLLRLKANKEDGSGAFKFVLDNDSVALSVNKTLGTASIGAKYQDYAFRGYYDKAGSGGVALETSKNKIRLAGNKSGSGSIYYQQTGFLCDVAGDKEKGGRIRLLIDSDSASAIYDKAAGKASIAAAFGSNMASGSFDKSGVGALAIKFSDKSFAGQMNPSGLNALQFKQSGLSASASLNKSTSYGRMNFTFGSDSIGGYLDKTKQMAAFNLATGGTYFGASIEGQNKGKLIYKDQSMELVMASEKVGAGMFSFKDNNSSYSISADKTSGNFDLLMKQGSDSVYASVITDKKNVGAIKNGTTSISYDISKDGDNYYKYADATCSINANDKADLKNIKYINGETDFFVEAKSSGRNEIKIKNGKDIFNIIENDGNTNKVDIDIDQTKIKSVIVKDGDKTFSFMNGDMLVDVKTTKTEKYINLVAGNKQIKINNEKLYISSGSHTLEYLKTPNELYIDGQKVSFDPSIAINFDGWNIIPNFNMDFKGFNIPIPGLPSIDLGFDVGSLAFFKFKIGEIPFSFKLQLEGFEFRMFDNWISLSDLSMFSVNFGDMFNFKISPINFDLNFNDLKFFYNSYADFGAKFKDMKLNFKLKTIDLSYLDKVISFEPLIKGYSFKFDADKFIKYSPGKLNFKFDKYSFDFEKSLKLQFAFDTKLFKLFDKGIMLGWDDKFLSYEIGKFLDVKWEAKKFFKISPINFAANWDDYKLNLSLDSLSFGSPFAGLKFTPVDFTMKFDNKWLTYDVKNNLKFFYDATKNFAINLDGFDVKWDKLAASFGVNIPLSLAYDTYKFNISGVELGLNLDKYSLSYTFDKSLKFGFDKNAFLVSLDEFSAKFDSYDLGFGLTKGLWFTDGIRKLDFNGNIFKLDIDKKILSFDIDKIALGFDYGGNWNISGSPDLLAFGMGDMVMKLGKTVGLVYQDAKNKFTFGDSFKFDVGGFTLGIDGITSDLKKYYISKGDFSLSYLRDLGFQVGFDKQTFSMGGIEKYFDVSLYGYGISVANDILSVKLGDLQVSGGGERLFGIQYKEDLIAVSSDYELLMKSDDKGVQFDTEGKITLINGTQKIIAGGSQPIRFSEPGGMDMPENSNGYSMNVAGIDIKVEPQPGNQVKVDLDAKFAQFEALSKGEGQMDLSINVADKHIATLYKNIYTWGLAIGDQKPDSGPQVEETIKMDGPGNIGYITHGSTSVIQVKIYACYSSKTKTFLLNGAATGAKPFLCMENVNLAAKFSPDEWYVKVAEEKPRSKWARIQPFCIGIQTSGYFYMDGKIIKAGLNYGLHESVKTPWIDLAIISFQLKASLDVDIGGEGAIIYNPEFSIPMIKVWLDARVAIEACGDSPFGSLGCCTLAAISINGELMLQFTKNRKRIDGKVEACVSVFDNDMCGNLSVGFDL